MKILGISDNHNAGAALVVDGELIAAVNEERINRLKNSIGFPYEAIAEVLRLGGLQPAQIDRIVIAGDITPSCFLRIVPDLHKYAKELSGQFGMNYIAYTYYQIFARSLRLPYWLDKRASRWLLRRRLRRLGFIAPVEMFEHHEAHAYSAFLCGPFAKATVITADAMGDALTATAGVGSPDGSVRRLFAQSGAAALNPYYSRITEYLGFKPNRHEGKITGLAAYGDAQKLAPLFRQVLHFRGPGFSTLGNPFKHHRTRGWYRLLVGETREDIAAACQLVLEEAVTAFVQYWVRRTGLSDVVLAGGIFENVKLNQRIRELPEVARISIFPNMGDGGLAAGAALGVSGAKPQPLITPYLGAEYDDARIEQALRAKNLKFSRPDDLPLAIARLLADRQVVPRFVDRMEYGPRALGNRTIYFRPDDPSVNDWLNKMLRRTEFMPFAPVVPDYAADKCFIGVDGARFTSRFMNMCYDCTDYMRQVGAGCVHVDNTARPQIVTPETNPDMYAILVAYEQVTGVPVLINTSFNMHEEPIVMTPEDAVRAYLDAHFRYLAIGPFLVESDAS